MTFPTLQAFLAGAPVKTQANGDFTGTYRDVYFRYVRGEYGVGHFEIRDIATNKLTIESIIDKLIVPTLEESFVEIVYNDLKFWHDFNNGQTTNTKP